MEEIGVNFLMGLESLEVGGHIKELGGWHT